MEMAGRRIVDAAMIKRTGDVPSHIAIRDNLSPIVEPICKVIGLATHRVEVLRRPCRLQMPGFQAAADPVLGDPRFHSVVTPAEHDQRISTISPQLPLEFRRCTPTVLHKLHHLTSRSPTHHPPKLQHTPPKTP